MNPMALLIVSGLLTAVLPGAARVQAVPVQTALAITVPAQTVPAQEKPQAGDPLEGRVIVVDPGHGGTAEYDDYRVGPDGEREEWINLRVALLLRDKLEERGARVILTRTKDVEVELADRALLAVENEVDAFVSVHHNATADPDVNFPIVYYHGNASENQASVLLAKAMAGRMSEEALLWKQDYLEGKRLMETDVDLERALELLSRSVRSFPDSWVAGKAHAARAEIMERLGKAEEAETILLRVAEFYVVP